MEADIGIFLGVATEPHRFHLIRSEDKADAAEPCWDPQYNPGRTGHDMQKRAESASSPSIFLPLP